MIHFTHNDRGHVDRTQMYQSMNGRKKWRGGKTERRENWTEEQLNGGRSDDSKWLIQMTLHSNPYIIILHRNFFLKSHFSNLVNFMFNFFHGQGNQFNRGYLLLFITAIANQGKSVIEDNLTRIFYTWIFQGYLLLIIMVFTRKSNLKTWYESVKKRESEKSDRH